MQDKKTEILNKALELFKEKGYDNVTVNEIASASNISKNTFYYYYESKEELIRALFKPTGKDAGEIMGEMLKYSDPYEQILCFFHRITSYFMFLGKDVVRQALMMNLSKDIVPKEHARMSEHIQPFLAIFERAVQEKCIRQDVKPWKLFAGCGVILMGSLQIWATSREDVDLNAVVKEGVEMMLKG